MHVLKLNFNGDPNIGLYGIATDKFCLLGKSVPAKYIKDIEEALGVPVYQIKVYGTDLIGIFAVATSKGILIPDLIFDNELAELKKLKLPIHTIKTELTALNNNILCNDKTAFVSEEYSAGEVKQIEKALGVKAIKIDIAKLNLPGSCGILSNKGGIFNPNTSDAEIQKIEKQLGFEIGLGSVNMGNPFVGSGVIANSKGFIVGSQSSGYEIARIDESLGFL